MNRGLKTPLVLTRCTIREWRADDAADLARHANDTGVAANLRDAFPNPYTVDDANIFLARVINDQPMINFCLDIGGRAAGGSNCVWGAISIVAQRSSVIGLDAHIGIAEL